MLSIIIPAYNEEERIEKSLNLALDYLKKRYDSYEIIVVDDGSTDRTYEQAQSFAERTNGMVRVLQQPQNMGKGAAVRRGMIESNGDVKIFTDADFSTPIYETEKIIREINNGADICIGSRALDRTMIKRHQPFYRELMGKTFNKVVQVLFFRGIKDTQCGFKGFTAAACDKIFPIAKINGFSFDVEILFLASKAGLNIKQVPVEWYNDARSKVNPVRDSFLMLVELFRIRRLHK